MQPVDQGSVRETDATSPMAPGKGGYFPLRFLTDMLDWLRAHDDRLEIITYDDLFFGNDWDAASGYPDEKKRFLNYSEKLKRRNKAQVLIQHDVDSRPERSMAVIAEERAREVFSSTLIFNRRVDRRLLKTTGELAFTDYELDDALLRAASTDGFLIGYHCNAMEQALWDPTKARQILLDDLRDLSGRFPMRFFTAHGGVAGPDGLNNNQVDPTLALEAGYRWVHNGCTPFFTAQYSDGGLNSPKRDPKGRDLRDFISRWEPGGRYRILLHPQYYSEPYQQSARLGGTAWYDQLLDHVEGDHSSSTWAKVSLRW
jgi:hypothetical protein